MIAQDITGIYETHLTVRNLDRSLAFYQDRLGFELARQIPDRNVAFLWVGGKENGMLGLWETGSAPMGLRLHFAFRAPLQTVLAAPDRLREVGITPLGFGGDPVDEPDVIGWMPAASVYFKDPDGHSIEMLSMLNTQGDTDFGVAPYSEWWSRQSRQKKGAQAGVMAVSAVSGGD